MESVEQKTLELLERIAREVERSARELKTIREGTMKIVNAEADAESEIPEKMRRFVIYMHCIHDISKMYEERGHQIPPHLAREVERCDDRYRQVLMELLTDTGAFEKIRREMAADPDNRWDHTRLITKGGAQQ